MAGRQRYRDCAVPEVGSSPWRERFFSRLAWELRQEGGWLSDWWSERRCHAALDGIVSPDGYGGFRTATGERFEFFFEFDRGTEDHARLDEKARRYAKALRRAERDTVVLLAVPSLVRASRVRAALEDYPVRIQPFRWTHTNQEAIKPLVTEYARRGEARTVTFDPLDP